MHVDRRLAARGLALARRRQDAALRREQLLEEPLLARRALEDAVDLVHDRRELRLEPAEQAVGVLEVAAREVDVAAQQRRLVHVGRVGEAGLELVEEIDRRVVVVALVHRPRRLEERGRDAVRVLRDLEVVIERVLRPARLVGHAAEGQPGQVTDLEVAAIDEERVAVGVLGGRDRAELGLGVLEPARLRRDHALEVARVGVEAAAAAHLLEEARRALPVVRVVALAALEVEQLVRRVGLEDLLWRHALEPLDGLGQVRVLQRHVHGAAVGGAEVRVLDPALEDALEVAPGAPERAEALERAGQHELGLAVLVEAVEVAEPRALHRLVEHALRLLEAVVEVEALALSHEIAELRGRAGLGRDEAPLGHGVVVPRQRRAGLVGRGGLLRVRARCRHGGAQ